MQEITAPTLLLNEQICRANIKRMVAKAHKHGLRFKPHMKTHQSAKIGAWMADKGVESITVSSVRMAKYFADHGWNDITIAFPCNIRQIDQINELADSISLTLLINSLDTVDALQNKLANQVKAFIEIDTGSNRTGLSPDNIPKIKKIIDTLSRAAKIEWIGFYSHPGHSYSSRSEDEILQVHQEVINQIQKLRTELEPKVGEFEVCIGDTPCCSVGTQFGGIDAISPGNFVFFDLMQHQIGSCSIRDIAVAMCCPIVDTYPERNELAIHGGAIHFSKESLSEDSVSHFGKVAAALENHWHVRDNKSYLKRLSQEHGIIQCSDKIFGDYKVGDLITILPVHSCLTANLMKSYVVDNGDIINQLNTTNSI